MAGKIEGKGVINWRITMVILLIIFVQNLIAALLYADSPFLIETYFPGVFLDSYYQSRLIRRELVTMLAI